MAIRLLSPAPLAGVIMATDVDALPQAAAESLAEADPDPRTRPNGDGPSTKPPRVEGHDHAGDRGKPRARGVGGWYRGADAGRGAGYPRIRAHVRASGSD